MVAAKTIFSQVRPVQNAVCRLMGVSLPEADTNTRAVAASGTALTSILIKALLDNGVLTATQLNAALTAAQAEVWDPET